MQNVPSGAEETVTPPRTIGCISPKWLQNSANCTASRKSSGVPSGFLPVPFARQKLATAALATGLPPTPVILPESRKSSAFSTWEQMSIPIQTASVVGFDSIAFFALCRR
jgi:hypothetical protein